MADAGIQLGKAYVQIIPSAQGIAEKLSGLLGKEVGGAGQSAGKSFAASLISSAKGILATAGLGKILSDTLSQGSELQQNFGGVSAVYGNFASSITDEAKRAYATMGQSASDYMATANKMGSLFQGSGLEQQRAMELSSQAMRRAADVASVMGIDMSMAMESIAGAAKGNFTMMDNLGVAMNATTLQAYALEKGINFKWNTASNAQKAELAMEMFFDRTAQYAGNFERESTETFSGAFGAMKAAAKNVMGKLALGESIGPELQALAQTTTTFLAGNLLPMVWNILKALPGSVTTFVREFGPQILPALHEVGQQVWATLKAETPKLLEFGGTLVRNFVSGISTGTPQTIASANSILNQFLSGLLSKLPNFLTYGTEIVLAIGTGVGSMLVEISQAAGDIGSTLLVGLISNLPMILQNGSDIVYSLGQGISLVLPQMLSMAGSLVSELLKGIIINLPEVVSNGFNLVVKLIQGLGNAAPKLVSAGFEILTNLKNVVKEIDWIQLGKDMINGIIAGVGSMASALWDAVKNIAASALQGAKQFLGIASPSKVMRDQVGRWLPAGIAEGIERNAGTVIRAMHSLADMSTISVQPRLRAALGTEYGYVSFGQLRSPVQHITNFNQTINSPEPISPAESTRYAEDLLERSTWKNP